MADTLFITFFGFADRPALSHSAGFLRPLPHCRIFIAALASSALFPRFVFMPRHFISRCRRDAFPSRCFLRSPLISAAAALFICHAYRAGFHYAITLPIYGCHISRAIADFQPHYVLMIFSPVV